MTGTKQEELLSENANPFAEIMEEVAELTPEQQERISLFIQGYVAAAGRGKRPRDNRRKREAS